MILRLLALVSLLVISTVAHGQSDSASSGASTQGNDPDVTTSRFRDWAVSCRTNPELNTRQCTMFQRLVVEETNQVALNLSIGTLRDDQNQPILVAIFTVPLGIWLPGGLELQVDALESVRLPIERCFPRGCQTGVAVSDELLAQFRAGNRARVTVKQAEDQDVDLAVSLAGFSAAFNALTETGSSQ
jgi:invasion protein IalB